MVLVFFDSDNEEEKPVRNNNKIELVKTNNIPLKANENKNEMNIVLDPSKINKPKRTYKKKKIN